MKTAKINFGFKVSLTLVGVVFVVLDFVAPGTVPPKFWSFVMTMLLPWAPDLVELLFGVKIGAGLQLAYEAFLIPAMVLGINLDWYKTVPSFDKLAHFASGVLGAVVAWEVMTRRKDYDLRFALLFILGFVALLAVGWETFEFSYDKLCDGHMQELISVGLDDTMWDMIMAELGAIATCVVMGAMGLLGGGKLFGAPTSTKAGDAPAKKK